MTLPIERYRAITYARDFLRDLLDPKKTPGIPKAIRSEAYYKLKHFPGEWEVAKYWSDSNLSVDEKQKK